MNVGPWIAVVSPILGAVTLARAWFAWRKSELRRDDVLAWSSEAIAVLQTLFLICLDGDRTSESNSKRLEEVRFAAPILVERGRLFFRNAKPEAHGKWKEPAYRGFRPCVLDHLVVAYQIACAWPTANQSDRVKIRIVAEDCLKKFVSLVQKEVGRDRTASADTRQGGDGAHLWRLVQEIDPSRLQRLSK